MSANSIQYIWVEDNDNGGGGGGGGGGDQCKK
jgi:hypothetical protein